MNEADPGGVGFLVFFRGGNSCLRTLGNCRICDRCRGDFGVTDVRIAVLLLNRKTDSCQQRIAVRSLALGLHLHDHSPVNGIHVFKGFVP